MRASCFPTRPAGSPAVVGSNPWEVRRPFCIPTQLSMKEYHDIIASMNNAADRKGLIMTPSNARIAVVDDMPHYAALLSELLTHAGFTRVTAYTSPTEALQEIQHWQSDIAPVVVISDYQMPGMTGVDLLDRLKSLLPIHGILITGNPDNLSSHGYPVLEKAKSGFRRELIRQIHAAVAGLSNEDPEQH